MFRPIIPTFAGVSLAVLTGTATLAAPPGPGPGPDGSIVAAWTQIVPGPASSTGMTAPGVELRIVIQTGTQASRSDASYCQDYIVSYIDTGGEQAQATDWTVRTNPDRADFPIAVCALTMGDDWVSASVISAATADDGLPVAIEDEGGSTGLGVTVPGPDVIGRQNMNAIGQDELRIVTVADTGCRGEVGEPGRRSYQDCSTWQFGTIVSSALQTRADLVVHAGDYRYFWEPDSEDADPSPDTWSYWLLDFFRPARPLLLDAPWVFARENHEICSWYGTGWFYLIGTGDDTTCLVDGMAPWHFDVAPGGIDASGAATGDAPGDAPGDTTAPHRFVVIDTSNDGSTLLAPHFTDAIGMSSLESTWWVTHIPAYNLLNYASGHGQPATDHTGDNGVRSALLTAVGQAPDQAPDQASVPLCDASRAPGPICRPSTVLMGHQHLLQWLEFYGEDQTSGLYIWPQQVIVGNGGVNTDDAGLGGSPCLHDDFDIGGAQNTAVVWSSSHHGYVVWTRSAATVESSSGWSPAPHRADGSELVLTPATPDTPTCN